MHPDNEEIPFPLILTGPESAEEYFNGINQFITDTLGVEAQQRYKVIINDPVRVAREMSAGISEVRDYRRDNSDAFYFNWLLQIMEPFQVPFEPTHDNMSNLELHKNQPRHTLAANLRRAFSGIVAGNVKDDGIRAVEEHGLFEIRGDGSVIEPVDTLLASFVEQHRMKLPGTKYVPCYRIIK